MDTFVTFWQPPHILICKPLRITANAMSLFHAIYEAHAKDVHRFVLYLSGDRALADDITSETFIRVWTAPEPVRLATVKAWLFTIARNLLLMDRRSISRREAIDEAVPDLHRSALVTSEAKQELERVMEALRHLPEIDRAALLMRANDGLAYEEIAVALGLSLSAVKVKIHRARLILSKFRNEGVPPQ